MNKKIDLSKLPITQLDGSVIEHDFSKELAQAIFSNTQKPCVKVKTGFV